MLRRGWFIALTAADTIGIAAFAHGSFVHAKDMLSSVVFYRLQDSIFFQRHG
jgi:hypothetical protein